MKRGKKFTALLLIFFFFTVNCTVIDILTVPIGISTKKTKKRGRQGAELIVIKIDGQQIIGELITVKPKSLLLLDNKGKDVSVDIANIRIITIVNKSKAGKGALYGLLIGGTVGSFYWIVRDVSSKLGQGPPTSLIDGIILFGLPGALTGAIIGAVAGTDETIQIEGMTDLEIHMALDKLRKKARIRDYK